MARNGAGPDRLEVIFEASAMFAWLRGTAGCERVEIALTTRTCGISAAAVFELLEAMPGANAGAVLSALETARVRVIAVDAKSLRELQRDGRLSLASCHARALAVAHRAEHLVVQNTQTETVSR